MTHKERRLLRLAVAIHEQLTAEPSMIANVELATTLWQQSEVLLRRLLFQLSWLRDHRL